MLAIQNKLIYFLVTSGLVLSSLLHAQQPQQPSQKYEPVQNIPPAVHVPPASSRKIRQIPAADPSAFRDPNVKQTNHHQEFDVPAILGGKDELLPKSQTIQAMQNKMKMDGPQFGPSLDAFAKKPAAAPKNQANVNEIPKFSAKQNTQSAPEQNNPSFRSNASMPQLQNQVPKVESFDLTPPTVKKFIPQQNQQPTSTQPNNTIVQVGSEESIEASQVNETVAAQIPSNEELLEMRNRILAEQAEISKRKAALAEKAMQEQQAEMQAKLAEEKAKAASLKNQLDQTVVEAPAQVSNEAPIANPDFGSLRQELDSVKTEAPQEHVAVAETYPQNDIRTVANEAKDTPSMSMRIPQIQVDAFGPKVIGINKVGNYKIEIMNQSDFEATDINVGITIPNWVQIQNSNLSAGTRNLAQNEGLQTLNWIVPSIPANSRHTMTVEAVPTKAEVFDVDLEWAMLPRLASSNVDVTQPQLEMKISGAADVLYGEKAVYHVTVRNPGTGTAENVVVMLPEALGGERAKLYDILPGEEKNFQVELLARTAGELDLTTSATADGGVQTAAGRKIMVRRAILDIQINGPAMKYAGTNGKYSITVTNKGDATARDIITGVALPPGVKYLGGIDGAEVVENSIRWNVGNIDEGDTRTYQFQCQLDADGQLEFQVGARGVGDLAAAHAVLTQVETVADLVLSVEDPKGPLPTGDEVDYTIRIKNRGSRTAEGVLVVMQYSKGIDPTTADGWKHQIIATEGQVNFSPIAQIEPGQEVSLTVKAIAKTQGTHVFRAQLTCNESDSREIAEGTTRFYGEDVVAPVQQKSADMPRPTAPGQFRR